MHPLYDNLNLILRICFALLLINRCFADLRHGYSMLKYGHKLERRMITSYHKYSILDCVEDCLRTTRCRSINYCQGAHFCQTNFENRTTVPDLFIEKSGWIYSDIEDWDTTIAGACSMSNCSMNEKCIPNPFGQFSCVISDCGIPSNERFSMEKVKEWDAIGLEKGIHITCSAGYKPQGSERFVCHPDGSWKTNLKCTTKQILGCFENDYRHDVLEFGRYKVYPNGEHECEDFCLGNHQNNFKYYGLQVE
nr:uncharacterized protein LOC117688454 [Crassostrea gigas]